jgi:hypothetical protein|tara:strand:- start:609 stop:845 length:237 start_codon:yes stop_codon:yes gene_type:complete
MDEFRDTMESIKHTQYSIDHQIVKLELRNILSKVTDIEDYLRLNPHMFDDMDTRTIDIEYSVFDDQTDQPPKKKVRKT